MGVSRQPQLMYLYMGKSRYSGFWVDHFFKLRILFFERFKIMTTLSLLFLLQVDQSTINASSKSSCTDYITIILHLTNFQWVLSHCVIFKLFLRIDKKPQTSDLSVLFYHYISRSLIYIFLFVCFGNDSICRNS